MAHGLTRARGARVLALWAASASLLLGCGSSDKAEVIARVGERTITQAQLTHWMSALAPEHFVPDAPRYTGCVSHLQALLPRSFAAGLKQECARRHRALQRQVLGFLIHSAWLTGEAAAWGYQASGQEIDEWLARDGRRASADARFTAEAELASARIRHAVSDRQPEIGNSQIAAFYARHRDLFGRPERRYFDIFEKLATPAAVRSLIKTREAGGEIAADAIHESMDRPSLASVLPEKRAIAQAIFAAPPHILVGPVALNRHYAAFEVTRVVPASREPLVEVRRSIERRLGGEQQHRALARFTAAWANRWIARTDCHTGYIAQGCRQYRGAGHPVATLRLD